MLGDFVRGRINKRYDWADWKPFLMKFDKSIEERRRGGTRVKIPVLVVCKLLWNELKWNELKKLKWNELKWN